ncbi:HPr-rel-A system PqqD family peptide chaperone [uncultured Sphingomonas sp.]|uniref:HPr-rel-A system PqqD family peptide chaperone n=1 Tax=uncultured Sphingomonas sp. TaxID=158754 RepID=UPI0035CC05AA
MTRYRGVPAAAIVLHPIDMLTALYHRQSGQTHLVASPMPEVLALLADEALALDTLLARLNEHFDVADADADALRARLDELVAIGLVERQ